MHTVNTDWPSDTLRLITAAVTAIGSMDHTDSDVAELCAAMKRHLDAGGHSPQWHLHPVAESVYDSWCDSLGAPDAPEDADDTDWADDRDEWGFPSDGHWPGGDDPR